MGYKTIVVEKKDGIAIITLNRPDKLNAVNVEMRLDFLNALDELEIDDEVRVVIVTGAGRAFCAGADISTFEVDATKIRRNFLNLKREPQRILSFEKPIIGAINGVAAGEGSQWLLQFDLMVASDKAAISWPATSLGMACPYGIIRLASEVGRFRAKEALMTSKFLTAEEACQWGLVTKVVSHDKLMDAAIELANKIKDMPPISIRTIKEAVNRGLEGYEYTYQASVNQQLTDDFKEGVQAFLEKRQPQFQGK
ncbi:MAG: enoyl-CoA hydratase/isomerase family protein [Dehalococcoidia bacterium]|nr:enoyl-CoA hydratase/isomerase family protein [Dehalococcoidia bacterium]